MASPPRNVSLMSNCKKCTMAADSPVSLQNNCNFHYHSCESERSMQTRVQELQSTNLGPTNHNKLTVDGCRRYQRRARAESKIQPRTSNRDQDHTRQVKPCSVRPTSCQDHQVHAETPIKNRNGEAGSSDRRSDTSGVTAPCAREELRRFLASSNRESNIEERIRSLERENVQMLLEVWRSKLEFVRAKRQLRGKLFRLQMEKILEKFK